MGAPAPVAEVKAERDSKEDDESSAVSDETKKLVEDLNGFPVLLLDSFTAPNLRFLLGVPNEKDPNILHQRNQLETMEKSGVNSEHAYRSLLKSGWNVEKAKKWLEENAEWLDDQSRLLEDDDPLRDPEDDVIAPKAPASPAAGGAAAAAGGVDPVLRLALQQMGLNDVAQLRELGMDEAMLMEELRASGEYEALQQELNAGPAAAALAGAGAAAPAVVSPAAPAVPVSVISVVDNESFAADPAVADKYEKDGASVELEEPNAFKETLLGTWTRFIRESASFDQSRLTKRLSGNDFFGYDVWNNLSNASLVSSIVAWQTASVFSFVRRGLISAFVNWPVSKPISEWLSIEDLGHILNIGLSLIAHPASLIDPEKNVKIYDFRTSLLQTLLLDQKRVESGYLLRAIRDHCTKIFSDKAVLSPVVKLGEDYKCYSIDAYVTCGVGQPGCGYEVRIPGASKLTIGFYVDSGASWSLNGLNISIYKDPDCKTLFRTLNYGSVVNQETDPPQVTVVPGSYCWIVLSSPGWYQGCNPMAMRLKYANNEVYPPERMVESITVLRSLNKVNFDPTEIQNQKEVSNALKLVDVLMCFKRPFMRNLLLLLLRTFPMITNGETGQNACRAAARIFNHWNEINAIAAESKSDDVTFGDQELADLKKIVDGLELTHEAIRNRNVLHWDYTRSSGQSNGPHLQTLIELVLAAKSALPDKTVITSSDWVTVEKDDVKEVKEAKEAKDIIKDLKEKKADEKKADTPEQILEWFDKYRSGRAKVGIINTSLHLMEPSLEIKYVNTQQQNNYYYYYSYSYRNYVADVMLTGGKWYFEITLDNTPNLINIGVITPDWREASGSCLQNDYNRNSWCFSGPSLAFYNGSWSAKMNQIASGVNMNTSGIFRDGVTVGCLLNLESREMGISFNGVVYQSSILLRKEGDDVKLDLYPAFSISQGANIKVAFAKSKLKYLPAGYAAIEDPRIAMPTWLTKYKHATEVTRMIYERRRLTDSVVNNALSTEVSLKNSHKLRFEVSQCDKGNADIVLRDDQVTFSPGMTCIITFNLLNQGFSFDDGKKDEEEDEKKVEGDAPAWEKRGTFIVKEVNVRCRDKGWGLSTLTGYVFMGMKKPEFESFEWTDSMNQQAFLKFYKKKLATNKPFKGHEPVGYINPTSGTTSVAAIEKPARGKFMTVKLADTSSINVEYVQITAIHGAHPLANAIGDADIDSKIKEYRDSIKQGGDWTVTEQDKASGKVSWTVEMDESLVAMVQSLATRFGVEPMDLDSIMVAPSKEEMQRYKTILDVPLNAIRYRFSIIKHINRLVTPLLHYVDVTMFESNEDEYRSPEAVKKLIQSMSKEYEGLDGANMIAEFSKLFVSSEKSLSYIVHKLKGLYFMSTKQSVFDILLYSSLPDAVKQHLAQNAQYGGYGRKIHPNAPRIRINRIKAMKAKELKASLPANKDPDPNGLKSMVGQMFTALKSTSYEVLRGVENMQLWNIDFEGEGSIDAGGPYRESITIACIDIMSNAVPLFIQCPNGRNDVGLNREKWIIKPSATNPVNLEMYEFVGFLMGLALRTKHTLSLDLPSMLWKQLLGEEVQINDLEEIDKLSVQAYNEMKTMDKDKFEELVSEKFVVQLSDATEVELKEGGREMNVGYEHREEFVNLAIQKRLNESEKQVAAIRKGLDKQVPLRMLSLFSWYDLNVLVCGNPNIDVDVLQRHTKYEGGLSAAAPVIVFFWQTLRSFNTEERQLFLRFVWGRNRLPASDRDWSQQFTINGMRASDETLPVAHTCFFSLDLPLYSTFEICRNKIHYAIYNCTAIDVDFNPASSSLNAWLDE
eukprot:TRINITY_DN2190_c0_g1_i1.p1 TRINITY_DN2190_c0_g1~~TRINITY_DN2190_c0_g1_i1.p1  ORF type:complete len:1987 (+),score=619.90 TRINITY_DN2190_c0_g1_i1:517-5961(+)